MARARHVGIIGAGVAGLRCADVLLQHGYHVTILEVRNRIGGRVCQKEIGGTLVDMGPNWIHGTDNNPIADISKATGTVTFDFGIEGPHTIVSQDGKPLPLPVADRITNTLWMLVDEALDWSLKNYKSIPADLNVFDYLKKKIDESNLSATEKSNCVELSKLWGSYIGSPVDKQSLKYFFMEAGVEGANLIVASTYKKILDHIAKPAEDGAEIALDDAVVSVTTETQEEGRKVITRTSSGKLREFDEVISTLPLGYLKNNKSIFNPPLPESVQEAIDGLGFGALEKIYLRFPSAFWHIEKKDIKEDEQDQTHPVHMIDYLNPLYVDMPIKGEFWNQECVSLSALPEPCAQPTLLFYLYGPSAEYITSSVASLVPASKEYFDVINTFLKPFYSRLPRYNETNPACQPTAALATQWSNDQFTGHGSYSNFQVGLEHGTEHVDAFSDDNLGITRGIWFAGEHTAPLLGLGTVTGAYWSGENTARRLLQAFKSN